MENDTIFNNHVLQQADRLLSDSSSCSRKEKHKKHTNDPENKQDKHNNTESIHLDSCDSISSSQKKRKKRKHENLDNETTGSSRSTQSESTTGSKRYISSSSSCDKRQKRKKEHKRIQTTKVSDVRPEIEEEMNRSNRETNDIEEVPGPSTANMVDFIKISDTDDAEETTHRVDQSSQSNSNACKREEISKYIANLRENLKKGPVIQRISYEEQQVNIMNDTVRKGKWLPEEDAILRENLEEFKRENPSVDIDTIFKRQGLGGTDPESKQERSRLKKLSRNSKLYKEYLCKGLNRKRWSCYLRAFRMFQDFQSQGEWSDTEFARFKELQKMYGNNWLLLADKMGRRNQHLIDKHRRAKKCKLPWSSEDDAFLIECIKKHLEEDHDDHNFMHDLLPWEKISNEMKTRTSFECRQRWFRTLRNEVINKTRERFEWTDERIQKLIEGICCQECYVEELIDFSTVWEHIPGKPSKILCVAQYHKMKRQVPNYSLMSFPDILDSLCSKYFK